jgi:ERF superfamily
MTSIKQLDGIFCTLGEGRNEAEYRFHKLKGDGFWSVQKVGVKGGTMHIVDTVRGKCQCTFKGSGFKKAVGKDCRHLIKARELEQEMTMNPMDNAYGDMPDWNKTETKQEDQPMIFRGPEGCMASAAEKPIVTAPADLAAVDRPPMQLIQTAIERGLDVDKFGKLFDLQERYEKKVAEAQFAQAMADAQGDMPVVVKDGKNPSTNSKYAKLETIQETVKPIYTHHGFSLSFSEGTPANAEDIRVTCEVRHASGYSRQYWIDLPPDDKGMKGSTNKTEVHAKMSSMSYGVRRLLLMVFNITTANEDKDVDAKVEMQGVTANPPVDADKERDCRYIEQLVEAIGDTKDFASRLFKRYGTNYTADLTVEQRKEVIGKLEAAKAKMASPPKTEGENSHPKQSPDFTHANGVVRTSATNTQTSAGNANVLSNLAELERLEYENALSELRVALGHKAASYLGQSRLHGKVVGHFDKDRDANIPPVEKLTTAQLFHLTALVQKGPGRPVGK